ncbi:MAG: beta-ketoacyl-[acyl-carrier-protein] synthase family protein [bacterium JZ-2024 1]
MRRVVVTGLGAVSAAGVGMETLWNAAISGKSSIKPIKDFDTTGWDCRVAAYDPEFHPEAYLPLRVVKQTDVFQQMGLIAAIQAVQDAELDFSRYSPEKAGIIAGSSHGGIQSAVEEIQRSLTKGIEWTSPFFAPRVTINHLVGQIAQHFGIMGWNTGIANSCATGITVIGLSFWLIRSGVLEVALAVSSEKNVVAQVYSTFHRLRALAHTDELHPEKSLKAFHRRRSGTVLGDGAGALVLESLESAQKRSAKIYGEILGFGSSNDAYHPVAPHPQGTGAAISMRSALLDAHLSPQDVHLVHCHATATKLNDYTEFLSLKEVFGKYLEKIPVTATKGIHGHLIGATGTVESALELFSLHKKKIPPIPFLDEPDPEIPLLFLLQPLDATNIQTVMVNSFGFGGHNASLIVRSFPS